MSQTTNIDKEEEQIPELQGEENRLQQRFKTNLIIPAAKKILEKKL